jgi:hypothetical protein
VVSLSRVLVLLLSIVDTADQAQALIHSDAARKGALEHRRSIKTSTYGIMFMSTPHQGGNGVHFGKLLVNAASVYKTTTSVLL